jgi:hypothetical protein
MNGCLRTVPLAARTSARCGYLQTAGQRSSRMGHKTQLYLNEPGGVARGDGGDPFAEGHAPAGYGKWGGFEYNCSCVLSGKAKPMPSLATE